MGKKAVKQYFNAVVLSLTVILFIFSFVGLYGGNVSPIGHTLRALSTLALPIFIVLNFLTLIYWAIRRSFYVLIPIIPLACCINYMGTIFQFGEKPEKADFNFIIASYNVHGFNRDATGIVAMDILNKFNKEGVDIICLQEFDNTESGDQRTVVERYKESFPYYVEAKDMVIMSRRPIKSNKDMPFELSNNGGMWADIAIDSQHTIRVFNVHMETTGINSALHQATKDGEINDTMSLANIAMNPNVEQSIADSYIMNSGIRGGQAIRIANEMRNSKFPIVLCGDFNDVPYSFTYNTLLGNLKDGFKEGGYGFGSTYRGAKGVFRIDYIFHADNMKCTDYYTIDQEYSDHNPVYAKIAFVNTKAIEE